MKITVIGATGMVGSRIVAEAADRGHDIIAASRHPEHTPRPEVHPLAIDASCSQDLDRALRGADAAVLTVRATPGQTQQFLSITEEVLQATAHARVPLLIVGGAGPLRSPNRADILVVDDPEFVAAEWKELAAAIDELESPEGDRHFTVARV